MAPDFQLYNGKVHVAYVNLGYISRLGIDVTNEKLGIDSYRPSESAETIIRLSSS
jgi:hypothetical protein